MEKIFENTFDAMMNNEPYFFNENFDNYPFPHYENYS